MVFKLYDKDMSYLTAISDYQDLQISEELEAGYKIAQFSVPISYRVHEEQKIEIDDYLYVIKEVNLLDKGLFEVYCKPYLGGLQSKFIDSLSGYGLSLQDCLTQLVDGTGWSFYIYEVYGAFQVDIQRMVAFDAIQTVGKLFQVEMKYDTLNKIIYCYSKRQLHSDKFLLSGANLGECRIQSNTYDLVTRLIPIGGKDVTITQVNDGCAWVENHDYTDEVITAYWVNSQIDNPDDLLKTAKAKIKELGIPATTYRIMLAEFDQPLEVGDQVRVIDDFRQLDTVKRVQKTVIYPDQPDKSFIELGSLQVSFDKLYKDWQSASKIVSEDTLRDLSALEKTYSTGG